MTVFAADPLVLKDTVATLLGDKAQSLVLALGELTLTLKAADYLAAMDQLRTAPGCQFEQLIDLCGVDYSAYRDSVWEGPRFCVVSRGARVTGG